MIGRFSNTGVYRELLRLRDFYISIIAGGLALAGYLVDYGRAEASYIGITLALISVAMNGLPIVWGAIKGLWAREVNVDELVSLAIIASLMQGEFLTAAVVSFVMTLGALIEEVTSESARKAIRSLINLSPTTARIIKDGRVEVVPMEQVQVGDRILVRPGDRIPVDAVVVSGLSAVDESSMTGEPLPREKGIGDTILAGTLNHNGVLEADVTKVGRDTTLGTVIKLVEEAESHRPEAVRLIDRYARWFTPLILACAGIAWAVTGSLDRAVAVLIVGCPCALILAAPTATVAALGRAARIGVLVKGGQVLERVAGINAVLFDKTGTLTMGEPYVEEIACAEGLEREDVLTCAASAEQNCTHPIARAVLKAAQYARVVVQKAEDVFNEIGLGVRANVAGSLVEVGSLSMGGGVAAMPMNLKSCAENLLEKGSTPLVVYRDHQPVGVLGVSDRIRPETRAAVEGLRHLDIKETAILSGDQEKSVRNLADQIGVARFHSELRPQDKLTILRDYQDKGFKVMFVGDGINDGPSLAASDVGIAMGAGGTDVALETADIALIHDDISKLPFLVKLSRRMIRIIKWNIAFGLTFNAAAVVASGSGLLTPIMAALAHNIGSVLVVMASASLAFMPEKAGH